MAIPFVLGLIVGFLVKKSFRIAVIAGVIIVLVSYFGFFNLSLVSLKDIAARYGLLAFHFAALLLGMLPLNVGLIIGLIIGFLFGQTWTKNGEPPATQVPVARAYYLLTRFTIA